MNHGLTLVNPAAVLGLCLSMTDESLTIRTRASEERDLLQRIRGGEIDRFATVIDRYQQHVARIVGRRVPADRVEEIVHDVFVRAYFGLAQYSGSVSLDHWLAGIAIRTCYDYWRARKRDEVPVSSLTDDHHRWIERVLTPQSDEEFRDQVRKREAAEVLEWAFGQLSPENRTILTLVHFDGYSVREAAELLGWSAINVKVRAHRARQALRKVLGDRLRGDRDDAR
jgi:RNA polymerase sigma-70 factor (ECF subfamily)